MHAVAQLAGTGPIGGELLRLQRSLHAATTPSDLLARATVNACDFCGFSRAAILTVDDGMLTADGSVAVSDAACDALRRRVLATSQRIEHDSEEATLIRRMERLTRGRAPRGSVLAAALDLEQYVLAPVMPESRVVAMVVVDRPGPEVGERERAGVELFAHLLGLALERVVLRTRLGELCTEVRHMTASANALLQEVVSAPVTVSQDFGWGPVFSASLGTQAAVGPDVIDLLTPRELEIVRLMAEGRSNRAIAEELHLAPNTIKAHVGRMLRKLGAANRAEAVGRFLRMSQDRT